MKVSPCARNISKPLQIAVMQLHHTFTHAQFLMWVALRIHAGVRDACTGGLVWGASGAAIIYGLRNLEPKMLGSNNLIKAGHPRMWYLITSVAAFGFYMRGETKLLNATRKYTLSGSAH